MQNDEIVSFFNHVQRFEIVPHVAEVPGMKPQSYVELVAERFANPKIKDTVRRVAFDGAARHSGFIHPTIRAALSSNKSISGLALTEALWARMCFGIREDGSVIQANDPHWGFLTSCAKRAKGNPILWIDETNFYGDIAESHLFRTEFSMQLASIWEHGVNSTIKSFLSSL
jgi:mannitol 2-dehydrogenase